MTGRIAGSSTRWPAAPPTLLAFHFSASHRFSDPKDIYKVPQEAGDGQNQARTTRHATDDNATDSQTPITGERRPPPPSLASSSLASTTCTLPTFLCVSEIESCAENRWKAARRSLSSAMRYSRGPTSPPPAPPPALVYLGFGVLLAMHRAPTSRMVSEACCACLEWGLAAVLLFGFGQWLREGGNGREWSSERGPVSPLFHLLHRYGLVQSAKTEFFLIVLDPRGPAGHGWKRYQAAAPSSARQRRCRRLSRAFIWALRSRSTSTAAHAAGYQIGGPASLTVTPSLANFSRSAGRRLRTKNGGQTTREDGIRPPAHPPCFPHHSRQHITRPMRHRNIIGSFSRGVGPHLSTPTSRTRLSARLIAPLSAVSLRPTERKPDAQWSCGAHASPERYTCALATSLSRWRSCGGRRGNALSMSWSPRYQATSRRRVPTICRRRAGSLPKVGWLNEPPSYVHDMRMVYLSPIAQCRQWRSRRAWRRRRRRRSPRVRNQPPRPISAPKRRIPATALATPTRCRLTCIMGKELPSCYGGRVLRNEYRQAVLTVPRCPGDSQPTSDPRRARRQFPPPSGSRHAKLIDPVSQAPTCAERREYVLDCLAAGTTSEVAATTKWMGGISSPDSALSASQGA